MQEQNDYLNETEVANLTSISVHTLRNQRWKGEGLPYSKWGRRVVYSRKDVYDFIEKNKVNTEFGV